MFIIIIIIIIVTIWAQNAAVIEYCLGLLDV
jgi:hypothetical protein